MGDALWSVHRRAEAAHERVNNYPRSRASQAMVAVQLNIE